MYHLTQGAYDMLNTFRNASCIAVACLCLTATAYGGDVPTGLDIPELTGTFTHGQAPISAIIDFGVDVENITDVFLDITGTGTPGVSSSQGAFPAELLVSVTHEFLGELIPPTVIGPYGESLNIFGASFTSGVLTGDFESAGGGGGGLTVVIPTVFEVVIASNPAYTEVVTASTVDVTNVSLSFFGAPGGCGDINCDGFVGIDDLNIVLGNWNQNVPPADPRADPSGDGYVGIDDLNFVLGNWNAGTPPITAASAVPEPASIALLSLGSMAVLRRRGA